jgi:hypothetical protein
MAANGGSGAQATTISDSGDPNVIAALRMGWHMAEMYGVVPVPAGPEEQGESKTLVGLDDLSSYRRQLIRLDQVDFALTKLKAAASWPDSTKVPVPDTKAARDALGAINSGRAPGHQGRTDYLGALESLHLDSIVALEAADPGWGSAYRLGRGLADTTRHMDARKLGGSFRDGRIGNLVAALEDLATRLPAHAGKAVAKSLRWWNTEISRALHPPRSDATGPVPVSDDDTPRRRAALSGYDALHRRAQAGRGARNAVATVLPAWRVMPSLPADKVALADPAALAKALPRQGQPWRRPRPIRARRRALEPSRRVPREEPRRTREPGGAAWGGNVRGPHRASWSWCQPVGRRAQRWLLSRPAPRPR